MGGGLYQISLPVLHWKNISFSAEFFRASMPWHAAWVFLCAKKCWTLVFFTQTANVMLRKKETLLYFVSGSIFLNSCTEKERVTQSEWLCLLDAIINIDNMSFICYAFVWKGLYYCRSEQKLEEAKNFSHLPSTFPKLRPCYHHLNISIDRKNKKRITPICVCNRQIKHLGRQSSGRRDFPLNSWVLVALEKTLFPNDSSCDTQWQTAVWECG